MATPRQLAANRANSQKSTGPRTPEGKAKSKLNAVSHGFGAATFFLDEENPDDFYGLLADLVRELQPATHVQQILVEKMAHNQWLSLRAIRLQSRTLRFHMERVDDPVPQDLALLIRYQTAADRAFHKAHTEFLKSKKQSENQEIGFVSQNPPEVLEQDAGITIDPPEPEPAQPAPPKPVVVPVPQTAPEVPATAPPEMKKAAWAGDLPEAA